MKKLFHRVQRSEYKFILIIFDKKQLRNENHSMDSALIQYEMIFEKGVSENGNMFSKTW